MKFLLNFFSIYFLLGLSNPTFAVVDKCPMGDCGGGDLPLWMAIPIFGAFIYIYFVLCWRVTLSAVIVGFISYLIIDAIFGGASGVFGIAIGFISWAYFSAKEEERQKNKEDKIID